MNKRYITFLAVIIALICVVTVFAVSSSADFGDFAGDNDYGGDFGCDGGSDGDGSIFDLVNLIFFFDSTGYVGPIVLIIVIIIVFIVASKKKGNTAPVQPGTARTPSSELSDISSLKQSDPLFSEADFISMVSNLYIRMQACWTAKNIEELRPYMSDALYSKSDIQLEAHRRAGTTNRIDRPAVLEAVIRGWKRGEGAESIIVSLKTRIVDYVIKDSDGSLVRGGKTAEKFMEYEWELIRTAGAKTKDSKEQVVHNCPNCGAPLNINRTARCEYCGSVITVKEFDWVLNSIKGISQQTVGK